MARLLLAVLIGTALTLLSRFGGVRSASATYPDIMGCEDSCTVAASGWPLVFVRDYTGMSVVNTADIMVGWFAAERFDWLPFLLNLLFWTMLSVAAIAAVARAGSRRAEPDS